MRNGTSNIRALKRWYCATEPQRLYSEDELFQSVKLSRAAIAWKQYVQLNSTLRILVEEAMGSNQPKKAHNLDFESNDF